MSKHIIELNGKRYDALTGRLLGNEATDVAAPAAAAQSAPALPKRQPSTHHQSSRKHANRSLQPSKTLMRRAVAKPVKKTTPAIKRQAPLPAKAAHGAISPKLSVNSVDPGRVRRAQRTTKSTHIDRFGAPSPKITPQIRPITPVAVPAHLQADVRPAPQHHRAAAPKQHTATKPAATPAKHKETADDIFDRAIANARSHETKAPKRKRRVSKLLNLSAGLAAFVVIGGFIAYVNRATIQLELASARAGFQANLPAYAPDGFNRQAVSADGKAVKISFVSPSSADNFTLTQRASDWDSQTLFDEISAETDASYQTLQSGGRTIYVYDGSKAAWVNGGILYQIEGNAQLDSSQLGQLASSL